MKCGNLDSVDGDDDDSGCARDEEEMATPKWFLVALSQCHPDQIAAADPPAAHHLEDENDYGSFT